MPITNGNSTKGTRVPVEPIRELLREHHDKIQRSGDFENGYSKEQHGPMGIIAHEIWGDDAKHKERVLFRILHESEKFISFDLADKVLCGIGKVWEWQTNPVLNKVYNEAKLIGLDIVDPTSEKARVEVVKAINTLRDAGWTYRNIGERVGLTGNSVSRSIR